ncbi:kinase-like protein [Backusella circina FSU 941]|nr:kinase-like protein [Backusella circina FSU 941]
MTHFNRNRNLYKANLGGISLFDTPTDKGRDSQFTLTDNSTFSFHQDSPNKMYKGQVIVEAESDWDSEPDLDNVEIKEASIIHRQYPSIRQQKMIKQKPTTQNPSYLCPEIGPKLDFGYQWPQKVSRGFSKSLATNRLSRLKIVEIQRSNVKKQTRLLHRVTLNIKDTFLKRPDFNYNADNIPKRILTKPGKPIPNEFDNENFDYILKVNEILGHDPHHQYKVIDLLGQGTFGQVVKCVRISTGELFSINKQLDPDDKHHILRLHHVFNHQNHLCLVFELLSYNLYDLISHNHFNGFAPEKVRSFSVQILDALCLLKEAKIIHCDLKPENILLESEKSHTIKVIDFGSACHEANRIYTYIQSRFYRSPEVLLGLRYTGAIDMWSFGCIVAELFLGIPLFPGISEYNQLFRIIELLGKPSKDMLSKGRSTYKYFNKTEVGSDSYEYEFKDRDQYSEENNKNELPGKRYFQYNNLTDLILCYNKGKPSLTKAETERRRQKGTLAHLKEEDERKRKKELEERVCILDFLKGVLELNPLKRWTPQQARQHPFITQKPYEGPYQPDSLIKSRSPIPTQGQGSKPNSARKRAQSMNDSTPPDSIQLVAKQLQGQVPISKYPKETEHSLSKEPQKQEYRIRNSRSQGDSLGLLPPETRHDNNNKNNKKRNDDATDYQASPTHHQRKVRIAPQVKVRRGSHDSVREDGQVSRGRTLDGKPKMPNVRQAHAGEAAGGLLMMRQDDKVKNTLPSLNPPPSKRVTDAFKRLR